MKEKLITKSFERLLNKGLHRGFITYEELGKPLGKRGSSTENLEKAIFIIFDNKISLVKKKSDYQPRKKKEELKKKYLNYIDDINQNSVVKNIFQKKDQNQQVELLNEILKELNEIKFSKKIDKLENRLMKEFDEKSYSDLIQLKSQINKE